MIAVLYTEAFEEFWAAYPKKSKKADAYKAWQQMGCCAADLPMLLGALQWQVTQPGWLKDGGDYIPLPATWLRARSFEDEPFQMPTSTAPQRGDTVGLANAKALADYLARTKAERDEALPLLRLVK